MELFKHERHRNLAYMSWLRKQKCVASGKAAEVAHHIRLGTNGATARKPSDYFCIPLTEEFHTSGLFAVHYIGEAKFFEGFKLEKEKLFITFLSRYLEEVFHIKIKFETTNSLLIIQKLIEKIEEVSPQSTKDSRTKSATKIGQRKNTSEKYDELKALKNSYDKETRNKIKKLLPKQEAPKISDSPLYSKAKEEKKKRDKLLRDQLKNERKKIKPKQKLSDTPFYREAKELKKAQDKALREKIKKSKNLSNENLLNEFQIKQQEEFKAKVKKEQAAFRKKQYQLAKQYRKRV